MYVNFIKAATSLDFGWTTTGMSTVMLCSDGIASYSSKTVF